MTRRPRSLDEIVLEAKEKRRFRFGEFTLDERCWGLRHGNTVIPLAPQPFRLLAYLIRNRDRVISKEELVTAAWAGLAISDAALASALNTARRAIGDDGLQQKVIVTYRKRGYRFVAAAEELISSGPPAGDGAAARQAMARGGNFVGRAREVADVVAVLERSRIVTLTGVGGSGKTRLAAAVAELVQDRYADGVFAVSLGDLADRSLVDPAVADAVGMATTDSTPDREMPDQIVRFLGSSHTLILLDGCEHVREPCARLVERIACECPAATVLATSRGALGVGGEHVWAVPSLSTASPCACTAAGECAVAARLVEERDAVRLFVERVRLHVPDFSVSPDNCRAVAELCRLLEGLPLAIELVAGRVRDLGVDTILDQIAARLSLPRTMQGNVSVRRHGLGGTIRWSYDLCGQAEQMLLPRASVFVGGFSLEALEGVSAGDGLQRQEIADSLSSLIDASLVTVDDVTGARRYYMLDTIREYASERLDAAGETERMQRRHMEWFAWSADRVEIGDFGSLSRRTTQSFRDDAENLRAATVEALTVARHDVASKLVARAWPCWLALGRTADTENWLHVCLDRAAAADAAMERLTLRLGTIEVAMIRSHFAAAFDEARALVGQARFLGDEAIVPVALSKQAVAAVALSHDDAAELAKEAIWIAASLGDDLACAEALRISGNIETLMGRPREGYQLIERARILAESADEHPSLRALYASDASVSALLAGAPADARRLGDTAVELAQPFAPFWNGIVQIPVLARHGAVLAAVGHTDAGATFLGEAVRFVERHEAPLVDGEVLVAVAGMMLASGRPERCARLLAAAQARQAYEQSWRSMSGAALYAHFLREVSGTLPECGSRRMRDEGRRMTRADAIAFARQCLSD